MAMLKARLSTQSTVKGIAHALIAGRKRSFMKTAVCIAGLVAGVPAGNDI